MTDVVNPDETESSAEVAPTGFDTPLTVAERPRRYRKPLAIGAAAAAIIGGALLFTRDGDDSPQSFPTAVDGEFEDPEVAETVPSTEAPTSTTPEVVDPAEQGTVLTAQSPEGIMEQLKSNFECMHNRRDFESQQNCLSAFIGEEQNDVRDLFQSYIDEDEAYWADPKNAESTYTYTFDFTIPDSEITDTTAIIIADILEPSGTATKRYTFTKREVIIEDGSASPAPTHIWIMTGYDNIEVGEVVTP